MVDTGYASIHHSKYWMPIHYDIKDGQKKKKDGQNKKKMSPFILWVLIDLIILNCITFFLTEKVYHEYNNRNGSCMFDQIGKKSIYLQNYIFNPCRHNICWSYYNPAGFWQNVTPYFRCLNSVTCFYWFSSWDMDAHKTVSIRARSQIPVNGLTGQALGGPAAGRRRRAWDFVGKILE